MFKRSRNVFKISLFAALSGCNIIVSAAVEISRHDQSASGLQGWRIEDGFVRIELNPLKQEQVRAFYLGRGFAESQVENIMTSCVYQIVIENISAADQNIQLEVNLADWRIVGQEGDVALKSKHQWLLELADAGATDTSLVAFRWATFPEQQYFKLSGDYGWGMVLFGEQASDAFELKLKWRVGDMPVEQSVDDLICPD